MLRMRCAIKARASSLSRPTSTSTFLLHHLHHHRNLEVRDLLRGIHRDGCKSGDWLSLDISPQPASHRPIIFLFFFSSSSFALAEPRLSLQLHRTHLRLCVLNAAVQRHSIFTSASQSATVLPSPPASSTNLSLSIKPPSDQPTSSKMLGHHNIGTPYVTPHILHKNYAQTFDNDSATHRECPFD